MVVMSRRRLGSCLKDSGILRLQALSNLTRLLSGTPYQSLGAPEWWQFIEKSMRSSQCQQKVENLFPMYTQGSLMPENSQSPLGNLNRELAYSLKLFRFHLWFLYSSHVGRSFPLAEWRDGKPLPNSLTFMSAAQWMMGLGPQLVSRARQYSVSICLQSLESSSPFYLNSSNVNFYCNLSSKG